MVKLNKVYDAKAHTCTYSKVVKGTDGKNITTSITVFDANNNYEVTKLHDDKDIVSFSKKTDDGKNVESEKAALTQEEIDGFLEDYKGGCKDVAKKEGKEVTVNDKGEIRTEDDTEYSLGSFVKAYKESEDKSAATEESEEDGKSKYYIPDSNYTTEPTGIFNSEMIWNNSMPIESDLDAFQTQMGGMNLLRNMYSNMELFGNSSLGGSSGGGYSNRSAHSPEALFGGIHKKYQDALQRIALDNEKKAKELEAKNADLETKLDDCGKSKTDTADDKKDDKKDDKAGDTKADDAATKAQEEKIAKATEKAEKAKQQNVANICKELFVSMKGWTKGTDTPRLEGNLAKIDKNNVIEVLDLWNKTYSAQMDGESLIESINNDVHLGWGNKNEQELVLPIKDALVARATDLGKLDEATAFDAGVTVEANAWITSDSAIEGSFATMLKSAMAAKEESGEGYLTKAEIESIKNSATKKTEKAAEPATEKVNEEEPKETEKETEADKAGKPVEPKATERKWWQSFIPQMF